MCARTWSTRLLIGIAAPATATLFPLLTFAGPSQTREQARPLPVHGATAQVSTSCRACHEEIFEAWKPTDHARANRKVDPARDAAALKGFAEVAPAVATPEMILGNLPIWQPLIPTASGRLQPHEMAYDPKMHEWFNVFGDEDRKTGEWGHWTGRGMNWNSMCAQCHMTGYQRGYDAATDSYHSTWVEQGVGCIQCHGPMPKEHFATNYKAPAAAPAPFHGDRQTMMQTCAPCHARNESLTDNFQPGDNYYDHYRVVLPVDPGVFYPDGQMRDEDFNWTSILLSRMGHAGVTCLDCHDPHTNKTILPANDNQLCMQCHAAPGRTMPGGTQAVAIDPLAHSHHKSGSAGNSCVACHMPTTTYMQRSPRHDHGWLKPDPLLTKELGIPNACGRCHEEKGIDWMIENAAQWYGGKLDTRQRARARAVTAAQTGADGAAGRLLDLMKGEDIPAWRATYLSLLAALPEDSRSENVARASLAAAHPLERAAAVRLLASSPDAARILSPMLEDPVRSVRLDAEWALSRELPADSKARKELDAYLHLHLDQPTGRLQLGQDLANRGDFGDALQEITLATAWDVFSPGIRESRAFVLSALNKPGEAGADFLKAAKLGGPTASASAFRAGLSFAAAGRLTEAEDAFRLTIQIDPSASRAHYNLGLLFAQQERLPDAIEQLRAAENADASAAEYPFALATVLLRAGDPVGAREAAERTLKLDPGNRGAREIIRRTSGD